MLVKVSDSLWIDPRKITSVLFGKLDANLTHNPGADYMGILDHEHIDNEWLDRYAAQGGVREVWDIIR